MAMSREAKLKEIQKAWREWSAVTEFTSDTGSSEQDEIALTDRIQTILKNNKQQLKMYPLLCTYGGYCTKTHRIKRR